MNTIIAQAFVAALITVFVTPVKTFAGALLKLKLDFNHYNTLWSIACVVAYFYAPVYFPGNEYYAISIAKWSLLSQIIGQVVVVAAATYAYLPGESFIKNTLKMTYDL